MRSDVKIGLVCLFVIILGIVAYFAFFRAPGSRDNAGTTPPLVNAERENSAGSAVAGPSVIGAGSSPAVVGSPFGPSSAVAATLPAPATAASPGGIRLEAPPAVHADTTQPGGLVFAAAESATRPAAATRANNPFAFNPAATPPARGASSGSSGSSFSGSGLSGDALGSTSTYAIKSGDTFGKIAHEYHVKLKALQDANPSVDANKLHVKQKINLPAGASLSGSAAAGSADGISVSPATAPSSPHMPHAVAATRLGAQAGQSYTIKRGDTLRKIAKDVYGSEKYWRKIARANEATLDDPDDIPVGTTIKLP